MKQSVGYFIGIIPSLRLINRSRKNGVFFMVEVQCLDTVDWVIGRASCL